MAKRKINMSDLVREALKKGVTKPADIIDRIEKEHGVTVRAGLIHNIKSMEKKQPAAKPGRKPGRRPAVQSTNGKGTINLQDISIVKGLLTRLGKDGVQELVSVLS